MIKFPSSVDGTDREDRSVTMVSIVEFNCMIVVRWRLRITGHEPIPEVLDQCGRL